MRWPTVRFFCGAFVVATLLSFVFVPAYRAVEGVTYPHDSDQFRDMTLAQGVLDGKGLSDPTYVGETIWYNPLLSWTIAGISYVSRLEVPAAHVASGPILNLLIPVSFFLLATALAGTDVAVLATTFLLLSPAYDAPWLTPSYSPWIFPAGFGFIVFCAGAMLLNRAVRKGTYESWIAAGAGLGLVFLSHAGPAVILGVCSLILAFTPRSDDVGPVRRRIALFLSMAVAALAVGLPLVWSILYRYRLHVENTDPGEYVLSEVDVEHAVAVLSRLLSPWTIVAALGLAVVVRGAARDRSARLLVCWLAVAASFFAVGWVQQTWPALPVPALVPQYHFYYYVMAAGCLLVGIGGAALVHATVALLLHLVPVPAGAVSFGLVIAAVAVFTATHYEGFTTRRDFQVYRDEAMDNSASLARSRIVSRLRSETPANAVVLANANESLKFVGPAGRYVVSLPTEFSNPYASLERRREAQDAMLSALTQQNFHAFREQAMRLGVTHVLLGPNDGKQLAALEHGQDGFRLVSSEGGYAIFAVAEQPR